MTKKTDSSDRKKPSQFDAELVEKWISIQEEEVELRQQEQKQNAIEAEKNYEFSKLALEADERTFNASHSYRQQTINKACWFIGISLLMGLCFLGYLVYSGNPELVAEILKGLGYAGFGSAGGYGIGYYRAYKKSTKKD